MLDVGLAKGHPEADLLQALDVLHKAFLFLVIDEVGILRTDFRIVDVAFDEIEYIDIVDCNAGDHGKTFATNFNPEINLREVTQDGKYWKNGEWIEIPALSINCDIDYPEVGPKDSYLIYHEEEESLVKNSQWI